MPLSLSSDHNILGSKLSSFDFFLIPQSPSISCSLLFLLAEQKAKVTWNTNQKNTFVFALCQCQKTALKMKLKKKRKKRFSTEKSILGKGQTGNGNNSSVFLCLKYNYLKLSNKTKALTFMSLYSSFMPPTSSMFLLSHMRAITIIGMDISPWYIPGQNYH